MKKKKRGGSTWKKKVSKEMINLRKDAKQKNSMKETDRQKTSSALPGVWLKLVSDIQVDMGTIP